jgi:hypothetical protein
MITVAQRFQNLERQSKSLTRYESEAQLIKTINLCQTPRWSEQSSVASKARNHVIVRNRVIEISDDDSSMGTSPSPHGMKPGNSHTTACFFINNVLDPDAVEGPDGVDVQVDSDSSSDGDDGNHPNFTKLVNVPGRELLLGQQSFEVKLIVQKAMDLVVDRLLFENGFPSLATRAIWNRRSLMSACSSLEQSVGSPARGRYRQLLQRIRNDAEYVKTLSKLVSGCAMSES